MKIIPFLLVAVLFVACKKDPIQYSFEGTVIDAGNNSAISQASVEISQKAFNSSLTSSNFELKGSTSTDAAGFYTVSFEREKATEFKIHISKEGYFDYINEVSSAEISSENTNTYNAALDAKSWIVFDLNNLLPSSSSDEFALILYNYRQGCEGCATSDYNYHTGTSDTSLTYMSTADVYFKFTYIPEVGGPSYTDSVYMPNNDTIVYSIDY